MTLIQKALLVALATSIPFAGALAKKPGHDAQSPRKAMMMEQFSEMDANEDGSVTQAEIHAYRKTRFMGADGNGDGALSVAELDAMMAEFRANHIKRRLTAMDTDGDGTVDSEEFARSRGRWMHRLDSNGDGAIDKAEIEKMGRHNAGARGSHHSKRGHHCKN